MNDYYIIEPEVAGGFGDNTEILRETGRPDVVLQLHYVFDGWLGDCIVQSTPCYLVDATLAESIVAGGLSGVAFADVEVSISEEFEEVMGHIDLPQFRWMKVDGQPSRDDFGVTSQLDLMISERALSLMKICGIDHAEVIPVIA